MKQTRAGLAILAIVVAAAAGFLLARARYAQVAGGAHRSARQQILHYTLRRLDDPIIVLGDSIVEASTLPRSACGHPIVNAGLNGASTASDLGGWLAPALGDKRAFAIIVALGTNDALVPTPITQQVFQSRYRQLLGELSRLTTRLSVLDIPAIEARERLTPEMQRDASATMRIFRGTLPELATQAHAAFLPLPDMTPPFTIDGVHLNANGYRVWEDVVMQGIAKACG
ncbi:SGNH/GDSL hydrolase family protein [Bradyrhizobium sp.]|uniref:SGNH/GDSL hydrolase family protein n=1 Tax=Bradyrhizobium sp. TaxID=376 RepID=UPI0025BC1B91|nr:SGNH/GDSL hydrolase family protein [Bradyrhizobium sp.]